MTRTTRLKTAMGLALSAFIIQVVGCCWLALNKEFTLFTLVAFVSLCLSIAAIFHSAKAGKQHGDRASTVAFNGSLILCIAAIVIGFMGYTAGV